MDVLLVGVGGARELSTAMRARPRAARDGSQLRRPTACRAPRGRTRAHPPTAIRGAAGAGSHAGPRVRGWRLGAWGHVASGEVTRAPRVSCVLALVSASPAPGKHSFPLRYHRTCESRGHAAAVGARARWWAAAACALDRRAGRSRRAPSPVITFPAPTMRGALGGGMRHLLSISHK